MKFLLQVSSDIRRTLNYSLIELHIQLFLISLGLAHFQALLTVSTPATSLNICNTEMYNDNLSKYLDQCSFIVECTIIH